MSLLMDALKKAEKDKQKAAEEADTKGQDSESVEESTQRLDSAPQGEADEAPDAVDASEEVTERMESYEVPTTRSEFSLEPMDAPEAGEADQGFLGTEASGEFDPGSLSSSGSGDISRSGEFDPTMGTTIPQGEQTETRENTLESTMPSERAVKEDLNAYFEPSLSMQRTQSGQDPTDTLSHTVVQTGLADNAQVTAETVFVAGKTKQKKSPTTAILVIVLLLVLVAGAGLYIYSLAPQKSLVPSRMVANQIQPVPIPVMPPEQISRPLSKPLQTEPAAVTEPVSVAVTGTVEEPLSVPLTAPTETGLDKETEAAISEQESDTTELADTTTVSGPMNPMVTSTEAPATQGEPVMQPALVADVQGPGEKMPKAELKPPVAESKAYQGVNISAADVKISRSKESNAVGGVLHSAYLAYQSGNDDAASAAYRGVLAKHPDNRDALLGLAALAIKSGDLEAAYLHYRKLLRLDPKDSVASTALFDLQGYQNSPIVTESRLKMLLDDDPNAAHIHFSLGNLYARQSRWAKAQQAFFDAYRIDQDNASYAYNLAVSLDQLQQRKAALGFYRRSLLLAQNQEVSFQVQQLLSRIESLELRVEATP